jgi:hypothetical protein
MKWYFITDFIPLLPPPARTQKDDWLPGVITEMDLYLKVLQLLHCAHPKDIHIPADWTESEGVGSYLTPLKYSGYWDYMYHLL